MRRTLSVCLSVRPVIVAIGNVLSSTASVTDVLFRHALRAAYRTAISAAQILVTCIINLIQLKFKYELRFAMFTWPHFVFGS